MDEYFKVDVELHLVSSTAEIQYYPQYRTFADLGPQRGRVLLGYEGGPAWPRPGEDKAGWPSPEDILAAMDKYDVDVACLLRESMMVSTGYAAPWSTNGFVAGVCDKYPDRFILQANVGPFKMRGVKNAIWELEHLVKERNCKLVKFYPPEDTYINDRELWPFYEKCVEMDIPVSMHTGHGILPFVHTKYCLPILLEDVLIDFPQLKVIAFHFGWPYHHDLNMIAAVHPNLYIGTSYWNVWALSAPWRFAELIGEAMRFVGSDRIVWGSDIAFTPNARMRASVEGWKNFQIPTEMQEGYGYAPITTEDRRKIFGENLAKLLKIDTRRRIKTA